MCRMIDHKTVRKLLDRGLTGFPGRDPPGSGGRLPALGRREPNAVFMKPVRASPCRLAVTVNAPHQQARHTKALDLMPGIERRRIGLGTVAKTL